MTEKQTLELMLELCERNKEETGDKFYDRIIKPLKRKLKTTTWQ